MSVRDGINGPNDPSQARVEGEDHLVADLAEIIRSTLQSSEQAETRLSSEMKDQLQLAARALNAWQQDTRAVGKIVELFPRRGSPADDTPAGAPPTPPQDDKG